MSTRRLWAPLAAMLILLAATSWAIVPDPQGAPMTVTVQGKLTGSGGTPIPPGEYFFTFSIWDAAVNGTNVWPGVNVEGHLIGLQSDGLWTAYLGELYPIHRDLVDDTARWLQVTVLPPGSVTLETFGRVKLASAPFALEAAQLNGKTGWEYLARDGDTVVGSLSFDGDNDGTLDALIDVVAAEDAANLFLLNGGSPRSSLYGQDYGRLELRDLTGDLTAILSATSSLGGQLALNKQDGMSGMLLKGGSTVDGATLSMRDAAGSATISFDADMSDNTAAILPNDAISAPEVLDEPGVAGDNAGALVALDVNVRNLLSRSITAPGPGYVLVMGALTAQFMHSNGVNDYARFGVSDQAGSFPASQMFYHSIASSVPSGIFEQVISVHGLFPVGGGFSSFYLLGMEASGTVSVYGTHLTVVYFPTAYGTVTPPVAAGEPGGSERETVTSSGLSAQDIVTEQAEAERFNTARIERELATLREEVEALSERLRTEESARRTREGDR
ncbi:MAG: hypothetical protein AB1792_11335 [Candidatus Zixiibacteriota bacterium]